MAGEEPATRDELAAALSVGERLATIESEIRHVREDCRDIKDKQDSESGKRGDIWDQVRTHDTTLTSLKTKLEAIEESRKWWATTAVMIGAAAISGIAMQFIL